MSRTLGLGLLLASLALAAPLSEKALTEADKLLSQPAPRLLYIDPKEPIEAYEKRHDEPLSAAWKRLSDKGFDVQLDREAFRKAGSAKLEGPECGIWWHACD